MEFRWWALLSSVQYTCIFLSKQKARAFKVMYYFYLQSNSSLLNLVLSCMKWSLPFPTRSKTRLKPGLHIVVTIAEHTYDHVLKRS